MTTDDAVEGVDEPERDDEPTPAVPRKSAGHTSRRVADPDAWRTADETVPEPAMGDVDPGL